MGGDKAEDGVNSLKRLNEAVLVFVIHLDPAGSGLDGVVGGGILSWSVR